MASEHNSFKFRITRNNKGTTFSPNCSSTIATKAACITSGCRRISFSISSEAIFSPPRLIWSLILPTTRKLPSGYAARDRPNSNSCPHQRPVNYVQGFDNNHKRYKVPESQASLFHLLEPLYTVHPQF